MRIVLIGELCKLLFGKRYSEFVSDERCAVLSALDVNDLLAESIEKVTLGDRASVVIA